MNKLNLERNNILIRSKDIRYDYLDSIKVVENDLNEVSISIGLYPDENNFKELYKTTIHKDTEPNLYLRLLEFELDGISIRKVLKLFNGLDLVSLNNDIWKERINFGKRRHIYKVEEIQYA